MAGKSEGSRARKHLIYAYPSCCIFANDSVLAAIKANYL